MLPPALLDLAPGKLILVVFAGAWFVVQRDACAWLGTCAGSMPKHLPVVFGSAAVTLPVVEVIKRIEVLGRSLGMKSRRVGMPSSEAG